MESIRLNVTWNSGNPGEEITCHMEEAGEVIFAHGQDVLVFVEGAMVSSFEDLSRLVVQDRFKDRAVLNVVLVSVVSGG